MKELKKVNKDELEKILRLHAQWLKSPYNGEPANLSHRDLSYENLSQSHLRIADLSNSKMEGSELIEANLRSADFSGCQLSGSKFFEANLKNSNLRHSILKHCDLRCANLSDCNLNGSDLEAIRFDNTIGNGKEIKSYSGLYWNVSYTVDEMAIGCEQHPISDWWNFSDTSIQGMSLRALHFWKENKDFIRNMIEHSPAVDWRANLEKNNQKKG